MIHDPICHVPSSKQHGKTQAKPILGVYLNSFIKLRHDFSLYTWGKTRHTPATTLILAGFFLISERNYLGYLIRHLLWSDKAPGVCGVGNKGVNIMNYVDFSVIYSLCSIAYVFGETIINPPGWEILGSIWSPSSSSTLFWEEGGWEWAGKKSALWLIVVFNHAAKCKLPFFAKPRTHTFLYLSTGYHRMQPKAKVCTTVIYNNVREVAWSQEGRRERT